MWLFIRAMEWAVGRFGPMEMFITSFFEERTRHCMQVTKPARSFSNSRIGPLRSRTRYRFTDHVQAEPMRRALLQILIMSVTIVPCRSDQLDLRTLARRARPAVVLILGFDPSGKVIQTGSGFFAS